MTMSMNGRTGPILGSLLSAMMLSGCVWRSDYDALQAQNQQLQQQNSQLQSDLAASRAQAGRLLGAIKYTVNSDQLFPSGSWEMSAQGKRIITQMASKLAPTQQNHLLVAGYTDNVPVGPALQAQGVTSNDILSQKRADNVMQFLISQGVRQDLVSAKGYGEADPVASNDTAAGRAKNRRVELSLGAPAS
jgi:chemotaxis protein MotB